MGVCWLLECMKFEYLIALGHVKLSGFMRTKTHNETYDNRQKLERHDLVTAVLR